MAISRAGRFIPGRFSHQKYGGDVQALSVARAFRDAVLRVTRPMTNKGIRTLMRGNRITGIPGVFYEPATAGRSAYWLASTHMRDGRNRTRRFNVDRHGATEAERLAEAERVRMLEAVEDIDAPALRSPSAFAIEERLAPAGRPDPDAPVADAVRDPSSLSEDERAQIVRAVSRRGHACWPAGLYRAGRPIGFDFPDDLHGGEAPGPMTAQARSSLAFVTVTGLASPA